MISQTKRGEKIKCLADTSDTTWSYSLSADSKSFHYLSPRTKDTSGYIYYYWSTTYGGNLTKLVVSPFGYSYNGTYVAAGNQYGGERDYILNSTGKYSITNYVKKLNCSKATVGIRAYTGSGTAKGKWSPDCAGTYTVLQ